MTLFLKRWRPSDLIRRCSVETALPLLAIGMPTSRSDAAGLTYALAGQIVGDNAYVLVVKTDRPGVSVENANDPASAVLDKDCR